MRVLITIFNLTLTSIQDILESVASCSFGGGNLNHLVNKEGRAPQQKSRLTNLILFSFFSCPTSLLPLCSILPLFNIHKYLHRFLFTRTSIHLIPTKPPEHAFEYMPHFQLEVILVIMRPIQERGHQVFEMRPEELYRQGVNDKFDETKNGFDDLPIGRGEKDKHRRKYFVVHLC